MRQSIFSVAVAVLLIIAGNGLLEQRRRPPFASGSLKLAFAGFWPTTSPSAAGCEVDQPRNLAKSVTVK